MFTYPRTTYLTWPFPSIVWLRSGTNMKVENLRSVPTWYKIRWPWSSTAMPFPIYVTCPWRSLFNSGPNSKWTWMSPNPNLNGPPGVFTYPRTTYLTWPFPSIVLAPFRYEHESRKSPFSSYLVQNPLTLILPRQCPFPSMSLAHDVPCSTLGRTVNELEWALIRT